MKHHLIQNLEDNLKGSEFQVSNDITSHWVYPCEGGGGIMYHLYHDGDLILSIELDSVQSLCIARQMCSRVSGIAMSKRNFVDFLIYLSMVAEEQDKVQKTNS